MTCALRQLRMTPRIDFPASTALSRMAALREAEVETRTAAVEPSRHRGERDQRLGRVGLTLSFPLAGKRRLNSQRQEQPKTKSKADPLAVMTPIGATSRPRPLCTPPAAA